MKSSKQTPPKPKFHVELNWKLALFALLFLPLLVGLGFWQLERAEEKKTIQESWHQQQALPPVPFADVAENSGHLYRRVTMSGRFLPEHYFLLENQINNGRLGYEVIMPFILDESGQPVLINRGWVAADPYREELPEFDTPQMPLVVSGMLIQPGLNRLIESADHVDQWPHRVLQIDPGAMEQLLETVGVAELASPSVLHLDPDSAAALDVDWQPVNLSPSTHLGYAVQWFAMALALLILTLFANTNFAQWLRGRWRRPGN